MVVTKGGKKKKEAVRVSTRSTDRGVARRSAMIPVSRTPGEAALLLSRSPHPPPPDQSADARAQGATAGRNPPDAEIEDVTTARDGGQVRARAAIPAPSPSLGATDAFPHRGLPATRERALTVPTSSPH